MQPRKHHYIPVFYLKRWAGEDGRICEFSRPHKQVVPYRKFPAATGFGDRLYELRGFPPTHAQQIEEKFFRTLDGGAVAALELMEGSGNGAQWSVELRSAWSRFLVSLLTRCPEDIESFRVSWSATMDTADPASEERYAEIRGPDDPKTLAEFIAEEPLEVKEKFLFEAYMKLLDNPSLGRKMNAMHWRVVDLPTNKHALLTSDRPIVRTNGLMTEGGHLVIPLSPRRLFVAAPDLRTIDAMASSNPRHLVTEVNKRIVGAAVRFVYGTDDTQLRFVANRMGTMPEPRLMEFRLAALAKKN